jgi:malate dehydrogenase (oxaloacetate-decarboxylating)(NADP+)
MAVSITKEEALEYHTKGRPGKIEVVLTKPCVTQRDLSLAYTPGVAEPVREIEKNPDDAYVYTAKGNLVAVISNGTAVLGLGNVGALAGKPVMEGKGVLFKRFADIDVFDIEVNEQDPDRFIEIVAALEPTFGGINLEDIKAPECFYIEEKLKERLQIPVFHDDQHGTAIISGAALLNALELVGKKIEEVKIVVSGAGASAIACADFYVKLGAKKENIIMVDTKGVIYKGRKERMNPYKERFASDTDARTLEEALEGADVFLGCSIGGIVSQEMVKKMAEKPIIFALANPIPEIGYYEAKEARPDAIVATGRSDYPNQVNNVLGFPFIFRGALDVRSRAINDEMKIAASKALAALAREDVPDSVLKAYGVESLRFGPDYIIPKPLDPRVLLWEAPAVAKAAMETGAARIHIDIEEYKEKLEARLGKSREVMRIIINKAKANPKRVVYPEGEENKIIRAAAIVMEEGIARPILLGREEVIRKKIEELGLRLNPEVVHPDNFPLLDKYVEKLFELRHRKGVTLDEATRLIKLPNYFGAMMVYMGDADACVSGLTYNYPEVLRPALQIVKTKDGVKKVAGLYIMVFKDKVFFFTDATVNIETTAEDLSEIAILAADLARKFEIEPKVAMLSFSNFGSTRHPLSDKVREAVEIVKRKRPDIIIDGEMQADTAVVPEIVEKHYPFSRIKGDANVLVFPDLEAANVAYKLLSRLGGAEAIGPILLGMGKSIHVLQMGDEVKDIVNITAIAVVDAQELAEKR